MKIEYRGKNKEENRYYREAWILYDEDNKKEEERVDKICDILAEKGWNPVAEYGLIVIGVYDKEEYKELVKDYKQAKKTV